MSLFISALFPHPVFCLEVNHSLSLDADDEAKRKKHRLRDSETTRQMHAAQIYAEMLGQVCHKRLYTGNPNGYQEVKPRFKRDTYRSHSCST